MLACSLLKNPYAKKPGDFLQGPLTDQTTVARIRDSLQKNVAFYEEILNYRKEGEPYWISLAVNPVLNHKGQLERFVSIQANVTETKSSALAASARLDAIGRSHVMLKWTLDGALANGEKLRLSSKIQAVCNYKGEIDRITLLGTDVTQQREAIDQSLALVTSVMSALKKVGLNT